jgi:hypothetical protein
MSWARSESALRTRTNSIASVTPSAGKSLILPTSSHRAEIIVAARADSRHRAHRLRLACPHARRCGGRARFAATMPGRARFAANMPRRAATVPDCAATVPDCAAVMPDFAAAVPDLRRPCRAVRRSCPTLRLSCRAMPGYAGPCRAMPRRW